MSSPFFEFKQFTVHHDRCGMKVGTDGILLGSVAQVPDNQRLALDIGTGSGLVALFLAQRFRDLKIDAVEIDSDAACQAKYNFLASPFSERLTVFCQNVRDFCPEKKYDLIVSNPPYYSNELHSPDSQRDIARGDSALSFEMLIDKISQLLDNQGLTTIIVPTESFDKLCSLALKKSLFLCKRIDIFPNFAFSRRRFDTPSRRVILTFSFIKPDNITTDKIIISDSLNHYTPEYQALTREFYLEHI